MDVTLYTKWSHAQDSLTATGNHATELNSSVVLALNSVQIRNKPATITSSDVRSCRYVIRNAVGATVVRFEVVHMCVCVCVFVTESERENRREKREREGERKRQTNRTDAHIEMNPGNQRNESHRTNSQFHLLKNKQND